jgi:hypothetical protein
MYLRWFWRNRFVCAHRPSNWAASATRRKIQTESRHSLNRHYVRPSLRLCSSRPVTVELSSAVLLSSVKLFSFCWLFQIKHFSTPPRVHLEDNMKLHWAIHARRVGDALVYVKWFFQDFKGGNASVSIKQNERLRKYFLTEKLLGYEKSSEKFDSNWNSFWLLLVLVKSFQIKAAPRVRIIVAEILFQFIQIVESQPVRLYEQPSGLKPGILSPSSPQPQHSGFSQQAELPAKALIHSSSTWNEMKCKCWSRLMNSWKIGFNYHRVIGAMSLLSIWSSNRWQMRSQTDSHLLPFRFIYSVVDSWSVINW